MRHMFGVDDPISYVTSVIICMLTHHTDTLTDSNDQLRGHNYVLTHEKGSMRLTVTKVNRDSLWTQRRPRCTRVARFILLTHFPCRFNISYIISSFSTYLTPAMNVGRLCSIWSCLSLIHIPSLIRPNQPVQFHKTPSEPMSYISNRTGV